MDDFESDYLILETPSCALPDLRFVAFAAGVVVVALAIIIVAVRKLRTW